MTDNIWIFGDSFADRINPEPKSKLFQYENYHQLLEKKYTLHEHGKSGSSPEWTENRIFKVYPTSRKHNHHALILLSDMHRQWLPDLSRNDHNHTMHGIGDYPRQERKGIKAMMYQHSRSKIFVERWRRCLMGLRYSLQCASFKNVLIVFCFPGDYIKSKPYHFLLNLPNVTIENRFVMYNLHAEDTPKDKFAESPDPRPNHMNPYNHAIFAKYVQNVLVEQKPYNPNFMSMNYSFKDKTWGNARTIELVITQQQNSFAAKYDKN